jgi:hypothetical protein
MITEAGTISPVRGWRMYPFPLGESAPRLTYSTPALPSGASDLAGPLAGPASPDVGTVPSNTGILPSSARALPPGPVLCKATFTVRRKADTFLDMRAFHKGIVWVNGHCLGRYWNIGPTQTMYLPGAWLRTGANEVVVMDLFAPADPQLQGLDKPILDSVK